MSPIDANTTSKANRGRPRFLGSWPKIGIRPAIDGRRRGVRESLEDQTMAMAKSTAALLSSKLRYPDGSPVQCVIVPHCIGGVAGAAEGG
jgi:L-fucose isomerase